MQEFIDELEPLILIGDLDSLRWNFRTMANKAIEKEKEQLKKLVETAIQFGIDSPELVPNKKGREKISDWMVDNTIKDINNE